MIPFSDIMKPSQNLKVIELSNILSNRQQIGTGLLRSVLLTCSHEAFSGLNPKGSSEFIEPLLS